MAYWAARAPARTRDATRAATPPTAEPALPPSDPSTNPPGGAAVGRLPSLALGVTAALLFTALPRGVLLPAVDRTVPWALGLLAQALVFSLGCAASGAVGRTGRRVLLVGVATLAGGLLAAELCDWLRPALVVWLVDPSAPYHLLILVASLAVSLPLALPLGALAGVPLRRGGAPAAWLLLGASLGFVGAPLLCELLLGWSVALRACALLGAAGAVWLAPVTPAGRERSPRLLPGAGTALVVGGAALVAAWTAIARGAALGTLGGPWVGAAACAAAALGVARPPRTASLPVPLLVVAWVLLLPMLQPVAAVAWSDVAAAPVDGLWAVLALGVPAGWLLGALLGRRAEAGRDPHAGVPAWASTALVCLFGAVLLGRLLPGLGPRASSWMLALLGLVGWGLGAGGVAAGAWRAARGALAAVAVLGGLSLAGVGRAPPDDAVPVQHEWQTPEGRAAALVDPDTGAPLLAVGGRAPLGQSPLQRRRLVHLPLLLHGPARDVLLSASGPGELAQAALDHDLHSLVWIEPFSDREASVDTVGRSAYLVRKTGSERMLIAGRPETYDVIVMAPDPLAGRRAPLVGTVEFFRVVKQRLARDGLFCQWWDAFLTHPTDFKAVAASAAATFEHVYVILDHPRSRRMQLGIVATRRPLEVDVAAMETFLFEHPAVHDDLEAVGLDGLMVACLVCADEDLLELLAPDVGALRDARPVLGVRAPARRLRDGFDPAAMHGTLLLRRRDPWPWIEVAPQDRPRLRERVADIYAGWQQLLGGVSDVITAHGVGVPAFEREAPGEGPPEEAESFLTALSTLHDWPYLDGLILGWADRLVRDGREAQAERYLRRALDDKGWSVPFRLALARLLEHDGRRDAALEVFTSVLAFDADQAEARAAVARLGGGS